MQEELVATEVVVRIDRENLAEAGKWTQDLLDKTFTRLREPDGTAAGDKLFPNGVELIDVEVSLGVPKGFTVKVKIAGPKAGS